MPIDPKKWDDNPNLDTQIYPYLVEQDIQCQPTIDYFADLTDRTMIGASLKIVGDSNIHTDNGQLMAITINMLCFVGNWVPEIVNTRAIDLILENCNYQADSRLLTIWRRIRNHKNVLASDKEKFKTIIKGKLPKMETPEDGFEDEQ